MPIYKAVLDTAGIKFGGTTQKQSVSNLDIAARDRLALNSAGRSLFGMPFGLVGLGHGDRMLLDAALGVARTGTTVAATRNIVEFGTYRGVTTMYLGMAARLWGGKFDTFDIVDVRTEDVKRAWLTETMQAHLLDLEKMPAPSIDSPAVLAVQQADFFFVDGGHKDVEVWMYNHFARIGTIMYVHDMDYTRFARRDRRDRRDSHGRADTTSTKVKVVVHEFLKEFGWRPILVDAAVELVSCGRVWVREEMTAPNPGSQWYIVNHNRFPNTIEATWKGKEEGGFMRVYHNKESNSGG